jgi:hypothetical protein
MTDLALWLDCQPWRACFTVFTVEGLALRSAASFRSFVQVSRGTSPKGNDNHIDNTQKVSRHKANW